MYYSCVITTILYGCETWLLNPTEKRQLRTIQQETLRKILKLSMSTPRPILYSEIGEIPIEFRWEGRQLMYAWKIVKKTLQMIYIKYNM